MVEAELEQIIASIKPIVPNAAKTSSKDPGVPEAQHAPLGEVIRRNSVANTILALVATGAALHYAQVVWVVTFVAVLLAFVLDPLVSILQRVHLPRSLSALIALLAIAAVLYGISYVFYNRAVQFARQLPKYSAEIHQFVDKVTEKERAITGPAQAAASEDNEKQVIQVTQQPSVWNTIGSGLGAATSALLAASFVPFLTYFMLTWKDHARRCTVLLFPQEMRDSAFITLGKIADMIRAFIVGNFLVGLFIGAISTAIFGLLGIPYFYFIGFISGFLSLVPYLGVLLAMIPPLLSGLGIIHEMGFLFIFLAVLGLHLFSLNVLYPKFLGNRLRLNPLAVTLALLFWGWIWGAMGLVLAIPMTAAMKVVFDHVEALNPLGVWLGE
jgi:predicted PurR-regulated permease PerM